MLILSRKKNEAIKINDDITITIVKIVGQRVHVGIQSPKSMPVYRSEVYEARKQDQEPTA